MSGSEQLDITGETLESQPLEIHADMEANDIVKSTYKFLMTAPTPRSVNRRSLTSLLPAREINPNEHHATASYAARMSSKLTGVPLTEPAQYRVKQLSSWSALLVVRNTVWVKKRLWKAMSLSLITAFVVTGLAVMIIDDPASLKGSKFAALSTFLNVFVGLLLGFFLASSVTRWYSCANGFLSYFDSVRNLQMQFHALGVSHESETLCIRYAILSAWMLRIELYVCQQAKSKRKEVFEKFWNELLIDRPNMVEDDEREFLGMMAHQGKGEPSILLWTWIASKVGRMAQLGEIPPMASPTYGRIMNICESAHGGVRAVRGAVIIQAPFIYVHMLATLVHLNNVLNGISFGLTAGITIGTMLQYYHRKLKGEDLAVETPVGVDVPVDTDYAHGARTNELSTDIQNMVVSFVMSVFGPFIYHALLEVAICIAQPFDNEEGALPTQSMTRALERDVVDAKIFSETLFHWERPVFGAPPGAKSPRRDVDKKA